MGSADLVNQGAIFVNQSGWTPDQSGIGVGARLIVIIDPATSEIINDGQIYPAVGIVSRYNATGSYSFFLLQDNVSQSFASIYSVKWTEAGGYKSKKIV